MEERLGLATEEEAMSALRASALLTNMINNMPKDERSSMKLAIVAENDGQIASILANLFINVSRQNPKVMRLLVKFLRSALSKIKVDDDCLEIAENYDINDLEGKIEISCEKIYVCHFIKEGDNNDQN